MSPALRITDGQATVEHGVLQVTQQLAEPFALQEIHFIGQTKLVGGQIRAADFDGGGENLGVVALTPAIGETGVGLVRTFEGRVA